MLVVHNCNFILDILLPLIQVFLAIIRNHSARLEQFCPYSHTTNSVLIIYQHLLRKADSSSSFTALKDLKPMVKPQAC